MVPFPVYKRGLSVVNSRARMPSLGGSVVVDICHDLWSSRTFWKPFYIQGNFSPYMSAYAPGRSQKPTLPVSCIARQQACDMDSANQMEIKKTSIQMGEPSERWQLAECILGRVLKRWYSFQKLPGRQRAVPCTLCSVSAMWAAGSMPSANNDKPASCLIIISKSDCLAL